MEKPDYEKISMLEYELGINATTELMETSKEVFLSVESATPSPIAVLITSTYQRLIDDCTKNPRWWDVKDDE